MATVNLTLDTQGVTERMSKLASAMKGLSEHQSDQFLKGWKALEASGAQLADVGFTYGVIYGWVSDDFIQYAKTWGIEL